MQALSLAGDKDSAVFVSDDRCCLERTTRQTHAGALTAVRVRNQDFAIFGNRDKTAVR